MNEQEIERLEKHESMRSSLKNAYETLSDKEKKDFKKEIKIAAAALGTEAYALVNPLLIWIAEPTMDIGIRSDIIPIGLLVALLIETKIHSTTIKKFYNNFKEFYSHGKGMAKAKLSKVI